jgi:hypothetical protein
MQTKKLGRWVSYALVAAAVVFAGCSTSGGEQKSVIGHGDAESEVKGDIGTVSSHTQDVFKDLGIAVNGSQIQNSGAERDMDGSVGDKKIHVQLNREDGGLTHVEVTAKEGAFQWDQDYAHVVLSKIMDKS